MDGKNRAASSYLSPGNPSADKEQNEPLAQVFHTRLLLQFFCDGGAVAPPGTG